MRHVKSTLFALLTASGAGAAYADMALNLTPGVTSVSQDMYHLHMMAFWICVVIGIVVFSAMFYAIIYHRKSRGVKPADFHSHPFLEIGWTIVPVLILIAMAIPASRVFLSVNDNSKPDMNIKVVGYQWKWKYEYLEDGVEFFSNLSTPIDQLENKVEKGPNYLREVDNVIVVPIHKKIRFIITSNDVNHAWWVPDLGIKRDAIPGIVNEAWARINKPGIYHGQCAELCGVKHAFMPIVVKAVSEAEYKDWVAQKKGLATQGAADTNREWTMKELMTKGEETYNRICSACHQVNGMGSPPTFPPLKGSKIATGDIKAHIDMVLHGKSGTAMQAFKTQLSDVELAAVITYERNAWGNQKGDSVQPVQMKAVRDGKSIDDALKVQPSAQAAAPAAPTTAPAVAAPPATAPAGAPKAATTATAPTSETPTSGAPATAPTSGAPATAPTAGAPAAAPTSGASATPPTSGAPATAPTAGASTPSGAKASVAPVASPAAPQAGAPAAAANPLDELKAAMERGEKVYMNTCAACHKPNGEGMPPTFPSLKGSAVAKGPEQAHIQMVLNGKTGTAMQAFKDQLKDQDLADVITYERNAWGNDTKTLVTPAVISAARTQQPDQAKK